MRTSIIALIALSLTATIASAEPYNEVYRPQFHFTAKQNWLNDPNGMVYYKGTWHLFFQHNPKGREWGNMTWGHATSPNLINWKELALAIEPDELGTIFSGSAVVDHNNTSGLQKGDEKVLVAFYTAAGKPFTQCMAYSNDAGATWTKYEKNPIIGHIAGDNRDPKVIWHEESKKWVMALYLVDNEFALFGSTNLKEWSELSRLTIPEVSECPDFFPMAVNGDKNNIKWVFVPADGSYLVGSFDGTTFRPEQERQKGDWGKNFYATQTYSDAPGNRRIQIAWMRGGNYPDMPFNQQMSFPCELALQSFPEGLRICRNPVSEIAQLRGDTMAWASAPMMPGKNLFDGIEGDLWEIQAEFQMDPMNMPIDFGFTLRGEQVKYDAQKKEISCLGATAPLKPKDNRISMHILLDRTSIEVFANGGKVSMSSCFTPDPGNMKLATFANGPVKIRRMDIWQLKSAWK